MGRIRGFTWNVNGIQSVYRKGFLDWLDLEKPDFVCLQETKTHPEMLQDEGYHQPLGYQSYWMPAEKRGYSGLAVYTKTAPNERPSGLGAREFDSEGRVQRAETGYVDGFRAFCQEPEHYTWWSYRPTIRERNIGWRLDYFVYNQEWGGQVRAVKHHPSVQGSDHCPVEIVFEV
jgi:exonuclease III